jgi:hypothetical protein
MVRRTFRRALYSSDSFDAILNQLGANLDVIGKWCAGTQLPEPLLGNLLRKFPKPEYRNVYRVLFARQRVFDEVASTSRTVPLNERFTGLDFYSTPFSDRPVVAVPYVAVDGESASWQKYATSNRS